MDIFDIFRNILVRHEWSNQDWQHRNHFRKPIWQNDDDDDEDDEGDFSGLFMPMEIFNFVASMNKTFNNLFQNFPDETIKSDFLDPQFHYEQPQIEAPKKSLRDMFLKQDFPSQIPADEPKQDISLDGTITPDNVSSLWKNAESSPTTESLTRMPQFQTCIKSVTTQIFSRPDGKEERRTIKDCEGNVTTTIKKQTGDKIHTITIKTDKNGVETRNEDLVEINQNQPLVLKDNNNPNIEFPSEPLNNFPWIKFFGPKL